MDSAAEAPERPFPQFTCVRRGGGRIRPPASTQAGTEVAEVANNGIAAPAELGERAELPLLASSTKDDFDKALAELKRLSEAVFVPTPTTPPPTPPPVSEPNDIGDFSPIFDVTDFSTFEYACAVHANFHNEATNNKEVYAVKLHLPLQPFASQLINALWTNARVARITGKWSNSRIVVAVSRKLRSVITVGYNGITSGYRVLGTYNEVVGGGTASGIGGPKDDTDQKNHNECIICIATSNSAARQPSSDHRSSTTPIAYVESQFPDIVRLFRAVNTSSLGAAYEVNTRVRLIRDLWERLGMEWPKSGTPQAVAEVDSGLVISISDLLPLFLKPPALGTFANHVTDHNICAAAKDKLLAKKTGGESLSKQELDTGSLLFYLLEAPIHDPKDKVPKTYEAAATCSAAYAKTHPQDVVNTAAKDADD
ncbi:hypothetical protein R3P38DRAFT_3178681 [Favolaschia claudopus]|uniref:Uncharacterized protein n=1 Tax=Favolaschia claudopus TaxID=2862362 RepID=A0AAW0CTG9_9AGAR